MTTRALLLSAAAAAVAHVAHGFGGTAARVVPVRRATVPRAMRTDGPPSPSQRRRFLASAAGAAAALAAPGPSHAAKGAAELDFEYYWRDLLTSNKASTTGAREARTWPAARKLDGGFVEAVSTDVVAAIGSGGGVLADIESTRATLLPSFERRKLFDANDLTDSYSFESWAFAAATVANARLPTLARRAAFERRVGRAVLEATNMVPPTPGAAPPALSEIDAALRRTMKALRGANYITGFSISYGLGGGSDDGVDAEDDREFAAGAGAVDVSVTVDDEATINASALLYGSGATRDGVPPTEISLAGLAIGEVCRSMAVVNKRPTSYFLDGTYREDPSDFRATQQIWQLQLAGPRGA